MFEGRVDSAKRLNLVYEDVERHYHVITNPAGAMARRYVCTACNKSCWRDVKHVCDQTCSDCMMRSPCAFEDIRIPSEECNRHFRSQKCLDNHKRLYRRKVLFARVSVVVARVEHLWHKKATNEINNFVRTVNRTKKPVTCVLWDSWRTCWHPAILFVFRRFVLVATMWKMLSLIACNAAWENIRSGTILYVAWSHIYVSSAIGLTRSLQ